MKRDHYRNFAKGAYFSEADLLGPHNLTDLHPSVELTRGAEPEADDGRGFLLAAKHPRQYIRNTRLLVGIRRRNGLPAKWAFTDPRPIW